MKDSIKRVTAVLNGEMPDRPPLFDLLRNDAVIEHFSGRQLTFDNAEEAVYAAYAPAIDSTRPVIRVPRPEKIHIHDDGREQKFYRWTSWMQHKEYADSGSYALAKRREIDAAESADRDLFIKNQVEALLEDIEEEKKRLGEVFFMPRIFGPGLVELYEEVGLEAFSYYLADCPDTIIQLLELGTTNAVRLAESLPREHGISACFLADDIAFNSGPLLSPVWLREHYFPRLARAVSAWHARGIKVLFHSDGNLNSILNDLVEAGIDGLNPIEVLAGMDVADIHRRYPHLFLAGGIDVSQLLPFGSPQDIRDTVKRAINDAEGRILVGSTTELHNDVPLVNYIALREAVLETSY